MRLRHEQLAEHLKRSLMPVYLISGDEPLLIQESCDAIRQACRQQRFTEREVLFVESGFDWQQILAASNSLSLFAERKLIELRLNTAKVGDGGKTLIEYCEHTNSDTVLLITMPKLAAASQKGKWFKKVEGTGVSVQLWPVSSQQLPQWIARRVQQQGLKLEAEAIQLICSRIEGNLLAAVQEIEKLSLLAPKGPITARMVAATVADSTRYNVFNLVDCALAGKTRETLKIIQGLRGEGSEATLILWALCREIRLLSETQHGIKRGTRLEQILQNQKVYENRKPLIKSALGRFTQAQLLALLKQAKDVDHSIKGLSSADPWQALTDLALGLAGLRVLPTPSD